MSDECNAKKRKAMTDDVQAVIDRHRAGLCCHCVSTIFANFAGMAIADTMHGDPEEAERMACECSMDLYGFVQERMKFLRRVTLH